ncbi:MAG: alpha/beta hydrolase [Myxococcota bacterium]|jgi:pimeloyl-ACP methyl ester carboxylesterase|nr:alpha/beta hydrolase [Myxococcota bacterium]
MPPESLRVQGSDGLSLHLLRWSSEGVPALLIHGFGNEAHIWDDFAPAIAEAYQTLALDLRGHGDSDWDEQGRYDYENHVADVEAVVSALGFERLVIVGHSLGGRVAMRFAAAHPEKMAGLVIVDSAPELDPRGIARITQDVEEHRAPVFETVRQYENYLSTSYPAATPTAVRRMAEHGLKQREDGRFELKMDIAFRTRVSDDADADEVRKAEEASTALLWDALGKIECPALVVRGAASDIMSADVADRMVDDVLANGTLEVVGQAGHSVMTDNPEGFRECVGAFMLGE